MTAALLRFELAGARRARVATMFAVGFAVAGIGVALAGLSAGGVLSVQGFARTSMSLLQLVLWVVPMLALLTGAAAGAELRDLEFIAALPLSRGSRIFSRWAALTATLGGAVALGLGAAGVVIALMAGGADGWRYLRLALVSELLLAATLAVGLWIGVAAANRTRALGIAMTTWFVLVIGMDLAVIALLSTLPAKGAGSWLTAVLLANPVDSARVLALALFQADAIAGPTGAALRRVLGGWGSGALVLGLMGWTVGPLVLAGRRLNRG
jgi:Cu-processing system permease protein